jgi:penicillin-binding protein 1A
MSRILIKISLTAVIVFSLFFLSVLAGLFGHIESRNELINYENASASVVLSEEGDIIGKFFEENRTNISYEDIPSHLISALIATEDARFFEHGAIDFRSLLRVLVKTILFQKRESGGGSTITQQLAKNMYGRRNYGPLSVPVNKLKEIILAVRLEKVFSKEEIITLYLNTVSFGENIFGIEAASMRYFSKKTDLLNVGESAVLVGILKANTRYNPHLHPENAMVRRNVVLKQMQKYDLLSGRKADSLTKLPIVLNYNNLELAGPADYFLVRVKEEAKKLLGDISSLTGKKWDIEKDGLAITTTLNLTLQEYASRSFREHLSGMQKRLEAQYGSSEGRKSLLAITEGELKRSGLKDRENDSISLQVFSWKGNEIKKISVRDSLQEALTQLHAGLLALDPVTGAVKAWVGGIDFKTQPYDQILARRQLASVFKPVLYTAALEDGMDPCQYLDNDSVVLSGFQDYTPENYDHSYGGKYSLAGALAHSMNVPTFSLFLKIGFDKLDSMWRKMGFSFSLANTPSLALGTAEANILEIATAYSTFSNGGYRIEPFTITSIKDQDGNLIWENDSGSAKTRIISERSAILMSAMLQKAIREGTGSAMASIYGVSLPLAGKTGTSQNYADAWFTAFSPALTIVSRVGASTPQIHFNSGINGSGSTLAMPLVALTLRRIQQNKELSDQLFTPFPDLPPELLGALDCPDFREKSFIDKIIDLLGKDKLKDYNKPAEKKLSFEDPSED